MLGHGYEVGANRSYNQHRITHTMAHVGPGDVLKLYDVAPPKALLGSVVINTATSLESAPIPQEWANTPGPSGCIQTRCSCGRSRTERSAPVGRAHSPTAVFLRWCRSIGSRQLVRMSSCSCSSSCCSSSPNVLFLSAFPMFVPSLSW